MPVATAAVRPDEADPTRGHLTLLHFVNDRSTLSFLLEALAEELYPHGIRSLVGPTHVLPFLGGGALSSHWHLPVPTDTPYQPPYASEHLSARLRPAERLRLFHFEAASEPKPPSDARIKKLAPHQLATDLLPLLTNVTAPYPMTETEARVMLRWLEPYRPSAFSIAHPSDLETPLGFILLYGARNPPIQRRNVPRTGRLWGGVQEDARRQGLGRALLQTGLREALKRGWQRVSIGPLPEGGSAAAFVRAQGGEPLQRYTIYQSGL